jgi:hypothetical protein
MPLEPILSKSCLGSMNQNAKVFRAYTKVPTDVGPVDIFIKNQTKQFPVLPGQFFECPANKFIGLLGNQHGFSAQAFVGRVELVNTDELRPGLPAVYLMEEVLANGVDVPTQRRRGMYAVLSPKCREDAQEGFLRQVLYHLGVAQPVAKLDS